MLRPDNAGANTAADHIAVLEQALAQMPDAHRHGAGILIRADSAGGAKAFLTHLRRLRSRGIHTFFSVGHPVTELFRRAIRARPEHVWHPALEQDGSPRTSTKVTELTGLVDLDGYPEDTRIVRCERPHPGAQLSLYDLDEGMRHQVFLTNSPYGEGSLQHLEVRLPCPAVHRVSHKNATRSGAILGGDHVGTPMRRARCKQGGTCHQVCTTRGTAPARGEDGGCHSAGRWDGPRVRSG